MLILLLIYLFNMICRPDLIEKVHSVNTKEEILHIVFEAL